MANWAEISRLWGTDSIESRERWLEGKFSEKFSRLSEILDGANILFYFSAFLQKPGINPSYTQMMPVDINGVMNAFYGLNFNKKLVVIIHTPGGDVGAVETITEYIHSKFDEVGVIVPVMAMSAGTMFALSCDKIIISRAGQLGPTDPQMIMPQGVFSVKDIIEQFNKAKMEILKDPTAAHVWAPILYAYGPALHEQATKVENYATTIIEKWLKSKNKSDVQIEKIIKAFHENPNFHGQRIGYDDLKKIGLNVSLLEESQDLQDAVMGIYHLATIYAENSAMTKMIFSNTMQSWTQSYLP